MVATTKTTWSEVCRITSAAVAKTWITSFFNNLAACGLVQTSDTGQLDPSTIAAVPAAGSYFGYHVYRFNDTQQSNKPVFLRFVPYVGSYGGANCGGVAVTIGFATDGAGNITGANTGLLNFFNSTAGVQRTETATATPCYAVHGEGYFGLCLHLARCNSGYLAGEFPSGITSIDGVPTPAEIRVLLHTPSGQYADGIVVAVTHSSPAGEWLVEGLPMEFTYDVVCRHADFNDLIWSNVIPKPM